MQNDKILRDEDNIFAKTHNLSIVSGICVERIIYNTYFRIIIMRNIIVVVYFYLFFFFLPQVVNTNTTTTLFIIYISYSMNARRIESNKDYYYTLRFIYVVHDVYL